MIIADYQLKVYYVGALILLEAKTMNSLKYIKLAIFDFDDTLAVYKDKSYFNHRNEEDTFYLDAYLYPDIFYDEIAGAYPPEEMKSIVALCKLNKISMYCLSGMRFTLHLEAKKQFIKKHYGENVEVIATSSQERKIDVVKVLKQIHHCDFNEILFIDDFYDNIQRMKALGIHAIVSKEVQTLIETEI